MYVCTYVCMYVRTYVCMYVRTYVCMYVRMYNISAYDKLPLYIIATCQIIVQTYCPLNNRLSSCGKVAC